jgi:plasmid maintenance system antidote protein VapI
MARATVDKVGTQYRRFNDWLLGELHRKKVQQKDMAEYIGVSRVTFGSLIHGRSQWTFKQVLEILDYFDASIEEII